MLSHHFDQSYTMYMNCTTYNLMLIITDVFNIIWMQNLPAKYVAHSVISIEWLR